MVSQDVWSLPRHEDATIQRVLAEYDDSITTWKRIACAKYKGHLTQDEIENEIVFGVVQAISRFDPEKADFPRFARPRAFGALKDYIRQIDPLSRLDRKKQEFDVFSYEKDPNKEDDWSEEPEAEEEASDVDYEDLWGRVEESLPPRKFLCSGTNRKIR